jgi:bifunctional non-homologous end joining protein LigD
MTTRRPAPPSLPFIEPLHPSEQEKPPAGDDWVHEIKWDGYRVQAHLTDGKATVYTRRGNDWTRQFGPLADAVAKLPVKRAIIDGEAVVLSDAGLADFHALRGALDGRSPRLRLYAFDLLMLDWEDLRELPLLERKARLQKLLSGVPSALVYVEHMTGDGAHILEHACRMGIEGIVPKRADSPYRSGRSAAWIKTKCERSDTFVVVGFDVEKAGRVHSLHVAWRKAAGLVYAGSVEIGIDDAIARELHDSLTPLRQARSPLPPPVKGVRPKWVEPRVLVEVAYPNVSEAGRLRHPKFRAIRDDD